ncbi:1-(5-phosphoribosyl)-5-[(5-phosphoribosylamino)methylideneamino]imidazole-4-carboxamide isomerase [Limosilactobacillus sp.]|uniref:1-(5-phosphoribosyl)-5-[(5- phosphoribosylamino)methylideneamino]imidazole-4- carboxamide isomerase n=1 Tax=Limosilactobacillus sp. TaxID=2773925 RepID=UPI00345E3052
MIFPAIDLQKGRSVRLFQGDFKQSRLVNGKPLEQAALINWRGIHCLHLVDLDGAKAGQPQNLKTVQQIAGRFQGMMEIGGGIRTSETIEQYLNSGISRVILGSVALKDPDFTKAALQQFGPDKIVIGVDGRDGKVATEGWLDQSVMPMADLIGEMVAAGAQTFIVTDVAKDGMMSGPNIDLLASLQKKFPDANIVASGGIRNLADIRALQKAGIKDMIAGMSLAQGTLTLQEVKEVNDDAG